MEVSDSGSSPELALCVSGLNCIQAHSCNPGVAFQGANVADIALHSCFM
jgi:hypothetical protein